MNVAAARSNPFKLDCDSEADATAARLAGWVTEDGSWVRLRISTDVAIAGADHFGITTRNCVMVRAAAYALQYDRGEIAAQPGVGR